MLYNLGSTAAFQMKVRENNISIGKESTKYKKLQCKHKNNVVELSSGERLMCKSNRLFSKWMKRTW